MTPTRSPGWQTATWRRPIRWRLLTAGAALTTVDVAVLGAGVVTDRLPLVPAGIDVGLLAAEWSHYLTRPIAITHAHRTTAERLIMTTTTRHPTTTTDRLGAALGYAERGWPVFPLRPGTKKPAVPDHPASQCDGTDPRCTTGHTGWEQRATTDPARITLAWTRRPRCGIAIACGPARLIVIDLDIPDTPGHRPGAWHLAHLERAHQPLPPTFTVTTPSGGQHRYYQAPPDTVLGNTASQLAPYVDTRACGGYVVAPPTRTTDGTYQCCDPRTPAELPAWFAGLLTPHPAPTPFRRPTDRDLGLTHISQALASYVTAAITGEIDRLTGAPPGTRNTTLFTVAVALGQLVGAGILDLDTARRRLLEAAGDHLNAGAYGHRQALTTIASGLQRGAREPRRLPAHLTTPEARA